MLRKHSILKLLAQTHIRKNIKINPLRCLSCNPLCTTTESPASPGLINLYDTQSPCEDFVVPSLASWVESYTFHDHTRYSSSVLSGKPDSDVDKISEILMKRHVSPDEVVDALNGLPVSVSNSLVEKTLKRFSNEWISAFGFFLWAKAQTGYMHTPEIYNAMVAILGKSKNFGLMWDLVKEMDELNNGYVTLGTMSKVMTSLAIDSRYNDAIDVFKGIKKYGIEQNARAMNVLMGALIRGNSVEHAYKVFVEFKDSIPLDGNYIYNVLIHGWCAAGRLGDAQKVWDQMILLGLTPDVMSYTSFIKHYCREKDFGKVYEILKEMQEKGCKPNVVTYTIVMLELGKAKLIDDALGVYERMKSDGCFPDTSFYSSLILILCKARRVQNANKIFEDMKEQGVKPNVMTYNTMIFSACASSDEETALKLLQQMDEDSCKPNCMTYGPLLKLCCRRKRMKMLNFLLTHMFKNDVRMNTQIYSILVHCLRDAGKLELACSYFDEMVSMGMALEDSAYKKLVEELERKGMIKGKQQVEKLQKQAKRAKE